jgi:Mlc titration factor MtfA (ptsG expression regulator)
MSIRSLLKDFFSRFSPWAGVRLRADPIPESWPAIVAHSVPLAARLGEDGRERLYRLMQVFLAEVPIEGVAGLEITEEIRATIAAQACLLLLHMSYPRYTRVRRVLVYPWTFVPRTAPNLASGHIVPPEVPLRGQAWPTGVVVLGWDSVERDALSSTGGGNVVLHEFAHMLDAEDGSMDGVPVFDSASSYRQWGGLLASRFSEHVSRTELGADTTLDPYGATNRAEFFAVATEAFFERPLELRQGEPELYGSLVDFYGFDPAPRPLSSTVAGLTR